mgnify:CR=1 FL=1
MAIKTLNDLYLHQLKDLYSACKQSMAIVTEMGRAAKSRELSEALIAGNQGIARGMETLASICGRHDTDPTGEHCRGMEGLVSEARKHAIETDFGDEDTQDAAIINRFGFNNDGAQVIAARLAGRPRGIPVGLNIGANKDSADRAADFAAVVDVAGASADFLTVNVSSPNTERLRDLQGADALTALLRGVVEARDRLPSHRPVFLKIAPDLSDAEIGDIAKVASDCRVDGIIATNTTLSREGLAGPHAGQAGGLSGRPLFERSTIVLAKLYRATDATVPIIGVGGVSSVDDAWEKIRAGASAVQIYSALIYQGFSLVGRIARGLDERLRETGTTLDGLRGTGAADWAQR